jgi:hypothetical protein
MPSSFLARTGAPLARTSSHRQQVGRRRIALLCGLLALAIASGLVGSLLRPHPPQQLANQSATGPFSYFPAQ